MMQEQLGALSMGNRDHRTFIRNFVAPAVEVQADKQGRVSLPQHLREYAAIASDVVVLGAGKYIEIWDRESHGRELAANHDIERIGEKLAEFGL
jgi:MraZ protein